MAVGLRPVSCVSHEFLSSVTLGRYERERVKVETLNLRAEQCVFWHARASETKGSRARSIVGVSWCVQRSLDECLKCIDKVGRNLKCLALALLIYTILSWRATSVSLVPSGGRTDEQRERERSRSTAHVLCVCV